MNNPKISVIVPVYNSEPTIRRCVDSVLAQTFTDFECLLIDDGSKDKSGEICDEYATRDSRIRVFHKENGGVSSARNVGLDNADGEWIAFVDSDDWVGEKYLEPFLYHSDADIVVMAGYFNCLPDNIEEISLPGLLSCRTVEDVIARYLDNPIIKTPWAKLFKHKFLIDIRFNEKLRIGEDVSLVCDYMSQVSRVAIVDFNQFGQSAGYFYSSADCNSKYRMTVREAVSSLQNIFKSYNQLNIRSFEFEKNVVELFYVFCQGDIRNNGNLWYNDWFITNLLLRNAVSSGEYLKIVKILVAAFPGVFYIGRILSKF
ncbi:MAG: glycosyltransferase family 2 protein [Candidatus Cryptobacteroides sp.]